jgi:hypothetical protein
MNVTIRPKLPIKTPGIYAGISLDAYHSGKICDGPSVSSTGLRTAWSKSMAHFYDEWPGNPDFAPREATAPMILGRAAHHLLLGEDDFSTQYIGRPLALRDDDRGELAPWNSNRKECKKWLAEQDRAGRTVLLMSQLEAIKGMARALADDPLVKAGALNGEIERSMLAKDAETGLWLKARPDAIPTDSGDYADIKTTEDVTDAGIWRALRNNGLHQQGALIAEVAAKLELPFTSFNLIFVESKRPHCVRVVPLTDDDLDLGMRQNRAMLRQIAACIKEQRWPGPGAGDPRPIGMPVSERQFIEARLELIGE